MKSYRLKSKAKLKAEVNVARVMQPLDPSVFQSPEIRPLAVVIPESLDDGPQKIEAKVSSRKRKHEDPVVQDYEMKCQVKTTRGQKDYTWRGKCEDTTNFAVAYLEGNEVKISLVDHWFKFGRVVEKVVEGEGEVKRLLTREERIAEAFGMEPVTAKKPRKGKKEDEDEEDEVADEEMDFTEKFEDDEELAGEEDEDPSSQAVISSIKLSKSGKIIEKALNPTDEPESSPSSCSSDGLDDSSDESPEPLKTQLTKEAFVNEMIRLGKVSQQLLTERLQMKFNLKEQSTQKNLAGFMKNLMDELKEGQQVFYVLKEEYKRQMPSHATRVQFQTGRK